VSILNNRFSKKFASLLNGGGYYSFINESFYCLFYVFYCIEVSNYFLLVFSIYNCCTSYLTSSLY